MAVLPGNGGRRLPTRRRQTDPGYVPPPKRPISPPRTIPQSVPGRTAGGGQAPTVAAPPRPQPPRPPSEAQFLGQDVGYQQALRQFALNLQGFQADRGRQEAQALQQFETARTGAGEQRERDLRDIEADFASRGLLHSGLYGGRLGEYEQDFGQQIQGYQTQYDDFLRQLVAAQAQLEQQQGLGSEQARQEALARRASRYGL